MALFDQHGWGKDRYDTTGDRESERGSEYLKNLLPATLVRVYRILLESGQELFGSDVTEDFRVRSGYGHFPQF